MCTGCTPPHWLSFGTARRRDGASIPATLREALSRLPLVYPLASFDVSGQWPVSHAAAWPNEGCSIALSLYTRGKKPVKRVNLLQV